MKQKKKKQKNSKTYKGFRTIHIDEDIWYWKSGKDNVKIYGPNNISSVATFEDILKNTTFDVEIIWDHEVDMTTDDKFPPYLSPKGYGGIRPAVMKEYIIKQIINKDDATNEQIKMPISKDRAEQILKYTCVADVMTPDEMKFCWRIMEKQGENNEDVIKILVNITNGKIYQI